MRKRFLALALIVAGLAFPAGSALALRVAAPPGPSRFVNADATFVGRVVEMEPVDIDARPFAGAKTTVKYRIAIVKVNQIIRGLKEEKTVRVGFVPPTEPKPGIPRTGRGPGPQLQLGQDGLFIISKHPDGKFYQAPDYGFFVPSEDRRNLENEITMAKKVFAIMADSKAALKSKDADDRLMAASILVEKYRTQKFPGQAKLEPIDAEESKLIMNVIANSPWQPFVFNKPNPQNLFFQLGINEQDGWKQPAKINSPNDLRDAVQAWLRDHGEYRIKRYVPAGEKQ